MYISKNESCDAIILWAHQNLDKGEFRDWVHSINTHPLTTCEVPERGPSEDTIIGLKMVSKAVLWACLQEFLDDNDEEEIEDEEEIDLDEED